MVRENKTAVTKRYFETVPASEFLDAVYKIKNDDVNRCIERISYDVEMPKRATRLSAGYDIFSPFDFMLMPGEEIKIPTGICVHMNEDEVLMIFPRSGHGFKYYCRLANSVGIIDADYVNSDNHGHIFVKLRNEGKKNMHVKVGEGIAQAIFTKYLLTDGDDIQNGNERNGGFGSTTAPADSDEKKLQDREEFFTDYK